MFESLRRLLPIFISKELAKRLDRRDCGIGTDQQGFTVIDLAIGMAMVSILAVVALPSIQSLMMKYRVSGAAREIMGDLMAARMKAVSQHRRVKVFFIDDHQYKICDDANGDNTVDNCEGSARTQDLQTNYSGVSVSATSDPMFNATGSASGNTTITLSNTTDTKSINVSITGQVQIN